MANSKAGMFDPDQSIITLDRETTGKLAAFFMKHPAYFTYNPPTVFNGDGHVFTFSPSINLKKVPHGEKWARYVKSR